MKKKVIFSMLFVLLLAGAVVLDFWYLPMLEEAGKKAANISPIVVFSMAYMNIIYFIVGYFLSKAVADGCRPHKVYYLVKIIALVVLIIFTVEILSVVLGFSRIGIFPEFFLSWLMANTDKPHVICAICGILFGIKPMKREKFR